MNSHSIQILELLEEGSIDVHQALMMLKSKINIGIGRKPSIRIKESDTTFILPSCLGNANQNLWI